MDKHSESDSELLENIARLHLYHFHANSIISSDDAMDKEHPGTPWSVPTREERELIVAEEILRFASVTDRPVTSQSTQEVVVLQDSTSDSLPFRFSSANTSTEPLTSEIKETKMTLAAASGTQKTVPIASVAGTSGSDPTQSAIGNAAEPSTSKSEESYIRVVAAVPIDNQPNPHRSPMLRPDAIPVTNRILAAMARCKEAERSASNSSVILLPPNTTFDEYRSNNNDELLGRYLEHLKRQQDSDASHSSGTTPRATPRPSQSASTCSIDEITKLNKQIMQTNQLEEIVTKTMQSDQDETGAGEEDEGDGGGNHQTDEDKPAGDNDDENDIYEEDPEQGSQPPPDNDDDYTTATTSDVSEHQGEIVENSEENDDQQIDDTIPNDNTAEGSQVTDDNEAEPSEFPELDDESLRLEWTRPEKRRLSTVLRDLSREIKRKELNHKKARLIKKGRVIAQAIDSKICAINKEITAVNKKSLRHLALPLDQIQEYDWDRVANVLNAKRTPQECRMYWKLFLHPSINSSEWTQIEIKAMEVIAQRHNFRNWDAIAEELNTGRNGYQCYLFYRQHMCPHSELRGK